MAKGDKSAVPATPMKSGGTRSEASGCARSSYSTPTISRMTLITERSTERATGKTTSQATDFRSPINGDTPGANKVIGKILELMMTRISCMQMIGPTLVRQVVWMNLGGELVVPIDSTSARQVTQDTVMLLRATGCEPQRFPSDTALDDWAPADAGTVLSKWKKKLRAVFGVEEIAPGRQVVARQASMPTDPS
ncbi:hypothetical protein PHMEG_00010984 [Phytophthora megakarya]|uniref:Eukaryotic/viral aspartic protease n=1 Tax=Phytophthora megakarya TaxID=4795 RepID=A0A225WE11_9STRA|nr:hypothetical protein PHMEG_00010984 [Phytophthora megakarya]